MLDNTPEDNEKALQLPALDEENTDLTTPLTKEELVTYVQETEEELVSEILSAKNRDELQARLELFNQNQAKKNVLRTIKLNDLLAKVENEAIERLEKRPDQITNKELVEYMSAVSSQIDRANKFNKEVFDESQAQTIRISNPKTEVNINVGQIDRDSKENAMNAVAEILKQLKKANEQSAMTIFPEESKKENPENEPIDSENIVYDNTDTDLLNSEE